MNRRRNAEQVRSPAPESVETTFTVNEVRTGKVTPGKGRDLWRRIVRSRHIYLMLLPVILFYIIYCYVPMYGIVIAWKEWRPKYGIWGSPWVGWANFEQIFSAPMFWRAFRNTLIISFQNLLIGFPIPKR